MIIILLADFLLAVPFAVLAGKVMAVPASVAKKYNIDIKWYKKYTTIMDIAIVDSAKVRSQGDEKSGRCY